MRTRVATVSVVCLLCWPDRAPARAQYGAKAPSDRATGETYHVEVGGTSGIPTPDIAITSESLRHSRDRRIDFVKDLGIEKTRFRQLKVVLRPATKHKFRFEYTPITYEADGIAAAPTSSSTASSYPVTLPVDDGPEVEGVPLRLRVRLRLSRPRVLRPRARGEVHRRRSDAVRTSSPRSSSARRRRFRRSAPSAASTSCRTSRSPASSAASSCRRGIDEDYRAKYFDFDLYGTVNFNDHVGAQVGYRSFDVLLQGQRRRRRLKLKGLYFGGVVRF